MRKPSPICLALLAVSVVLSFAIVTDSHGQNRSPDDLRARVRDDGHLRVIVGLDVAPEPGRDPAGSAADAAYRGRVASAQQMVLNALPVVTGLNGDSVKRFMFIPFMALDVDPAGLEYLLRTPAVISIEEDVALPPHLAESTPRVRATNAWAAGYSGSGQTVAILDTGVDKAHSFLSGKVVSEACYSTTSGPSTSVCPGGVASSTASGSGVPCSSSTNGCNHGTHVAGITAGKGTSFSGVARDANVIAVQVFSRFAASADCSPNSAPCVKSYVSDQILGLERVYALRTSFTISSVNMSLGGGRFTSNCDSSAGQKAAIDSLRAAGIATVISSGNDSYKDAISSPACISTAVSVGSTLDTAETVSTFSNSASFLRLLAPGQVINSSVPGGTFSNLSGTSMAAPHVTGAFAVLRQKCPAATIDEMISALTSTGLGITDSNGISKPRINVEAALAALCSQGTNCGTTGLSSTLEASASRSWEAGGIAIRPPGITGLPEDGVWRREPRKSGETWTYTFTVREAASAVSKPAFAETAANGATARISDPTMAIPDFGAIQSRFVTEAEKSRFSGDAAAGAIAGVSAAQSGASSALGSSARVSRLDAPAALTAGIRGVPGLSAFDVGFENGTSDQRIYSARLFLKLLHPRGDQVHVWLATSDRALLLWSSSHSMDGAIVVDRFLSEELRGLPLSEPLTIFVSNAAEDGSPQLEQAWLLVTAGSSPASATPASAPQATFDVEAMWAYLRTASSGGGVEVSTPTVGQTVYLHVDYQVPGSGNSFYLNHRATLDGSLFCSYDVLTSPGYWYYAWCGSGWAATSGSHTLRWDLDYYNTVAETNELNNAVSKSFTSSGGVDIVTQRSFLRNASGGGGSEIATPSVGQAIYFHVDYQVSGSGSTIDFNHRATLDGNLFCSFNALGAPGNAYYAWCGSAWTATAGSHIVRWDLDYANAIAETNENNNSATKTFTTSATVDVAAQRAYMRTAANGGSEVSVPAIGQNIYFHVDYQLTGSGTYSLGHRALLDGAIVCAFDAAATAGNSYIGWCGGAWTATAGSHTLRWDLDYNGNIAESNEANNAASMTFTPSGGLDVAAQRAFLKTASSNGGTEVSQPAVGQTVFFHGSYQVTGSGNPITVAQRAVLDGTTYCSCQTAATPASSYVSSCGQGWTATAGTHTLQWELDYTNGVPETNENNNIASSTFTVGNVGLPTVTTDAATAVTATGATLNGIVNPNGSTTTTTFEYGLTISYGSTVAGQTRSGSTAQSISASIGGLGCGTTWHFRAKGVNGNGSNVGADMTFTTLPCATRLYIVSACRLFDSRNAAGPYGGPAISSGETRTIIAAGSCGIPAGAKAAVINVVAISPSSTGWLTIYPAGIVLPGNSTINYRPDRTRANNAIVMLSGNGSIAVYNGGSGLLHFLIDVTGYFQ